MLSIVSFVIGEGERCRGERGMSYFLEYSDSNLHFVINNNVLFLLAELEILMGGILLGGQLPWPVLSSRPSSWGYSLQ